MRDGDGFSEYAEACTRRGTFVESWAHSQCKASR
jgi:hypothetical protein